MPTTNQILSEDIARGFFCGDCEGGLRLCVERGCAELRDQIKRTLDRKDGEWNERLESAAEMIEDELGDKHVTKARARLVRSFKTKRP